MSTYPGKKTSLLNALFSQRIERRWCHGQHFERWFCSMWLSRVWWDKITEQIPEIQNKHVLRFASPRSIPRNYFPVLCTYVLPSTCHLANSHQIFMNLQGKNENPPRFDCLTQPPLSDFARTSCFQVVGLLKTIWFNIFNFFLWLCCVVFIAKADCQICILCNNVVLNDLIEICKSTTTLVFLVNRVSIV